MDKIAVLIPCYNEENTIGKVVCDFRCVLPEAQIYVYDNNSTDKTVAKAEAAGAIVRFERAQGKGNVVRRMFQDITAQCYILVDGDDTYPADMARKMSEAILDNQRIDMVIGDRLSSTYFVENKRLFHNFGNRMVRGAINRIFNSEIKDIMTGYRAFSNRFVKTFPVLSKGFEIETEMTVHAISMDLKIEQIEVEYRDRPEGSKSKLNTLPDGFRVLFTLFNLYRNYRPLSFFSYIALFMFVLSMTFMIPLVIIPFLNTGLVVRFPTLFVCGFVAMGALLSFFCGLVLDSIRMKERRDFEFKLMVTEMFEKMEH